MVTREALEGPEDKESTEAAAAEVPPVTASTEAFGKSIFLNLLLNNLL